MKMSRKLKIDKTHTLRFNEVFSEGNRISTFFEGRAVIETIYKNGKLTRRRIGKNV